MTSALLIERYRDSATMTSSYMLKKLVAATMTSSYMLEEAMSSRDDVSNQQLSRSARTGFSNDNVSSVVITFSRKLQ
ncbi:Disease resistance protein [Dorcoceras hygrometricum]|uniref:Disease resistance protein n=1 Tax=Dorcoceras hygrometricum TaxID=472368 RepID=A0A2Z7BJX6_9LAMI|nr:Disease resistance protein [Dorcoceras hygrometricum]